MRTRKLIVTHHAPDIDAVTGVWLLKRYDSHHHADAKVAFVSPGDQISEAELATLKINREEVTHVDTGLGEFDHHQPDRGREFLSATSLVYDHLVERYPDLVNDSALRVIKELVTELDHFGEVFWPDSGNYRYSLMVHELLGGLESLELHDDDSLLHFGMTCLDAAHASLTQQIKAEQIISEKGIHFKIKQGPCLGLDTRNDDSIKVAQKQGYVLVVRKDSQEGNVRIKARPDVDIDLIEVAEKIKARDSVGTWYYHPSGKMLLNGSRKHKDQKPSSLALAEIIKLIEETYG